MHTRKNEKGIKKEESSCKNKEMEEKIEVKGKPRIDGKPFSSTRKVYSLSFEKWLNQVAGRSDD